MRERPHSPAHPAPLPPVDAAAFRRAMRNPACAVAVVAAAGPDGRAGITATAVCSLADAPPSVLACVHRSSRFHGVIETARSFSINYLAADQVELANVFAGRTGAQGEERFTDALWSISATGAPVLRDALAAFGCHLDRIVDHATHSLFIGTVAEVFYAEHRAPLVYSRGTFSLPQPLI